MYNELVIDHFTNPRNVGSIENPDGYGKVDSEECGDMMEMYIMVEDDRIVDVKYRTFGCAAAIASSSMASEMITGATLQEAERISDESIGDALGGLPDVKMHCSVLAASALHEALQDYYRKQA